MFIQLQAVYDGAPDRPVLVNVNQITYVEADTDKTWCSVCFHGVAVDRDNDTIACLIAVRETYQQVVERILATQFTPPPVAT